FVSLPRASLASCTRLERKGGAEPFQRREKNLSDGSSPAWLDFVGVSPLASGLGILGLVVQYGCKAQPGILGLVVQYGWKAQPGILGPVVQYGCKAQPGILGPVVQYGCKAQPGILGPVVQYGCKAQPGILGLVVQYGCKAQPGILGLVVQCGWKAQPGILGPVVQYGCKAQPGILGPVVQYGCKAQPGILGLVVQYGCKAQPGILGLVVQYGCKARQASGLGILGLVMQPGLGSAKPLLLGEGANQSLGLPVDNLSGGLDLIQAYDQESHFWRFLLFVCVCETWSFPLSRKPLSPLPALPSPSSSCLSRPLPWAKPSPACLLSLLP
uniref:Uncharacterized protein n=1 Tax=Naja naja TaxID=35670 RepID=A0A8C6YDD1_NAJNA